MEVFWNTIAEYNAATWIWQIAWVVIGAILTLLLYFRPTRGVRTAMKVYMAALNFWIAIVYYMVYCREREYNDMLAIFWGVMGCIWIYDLAIKHASLARTGNHTLFAVLLFAMPLLYPLMSLAMGRSFPMMTSPVMPCSVVVFTIGLMLAFSERVNMILAMMLCHWAFIGLSKVYFFGIPEDYLMACSVVPALYVFLREYIVWVGSHGVSKPSPRVLRALLLVLCVIVAISFLYTLAWQFELFIDM